MRNGDDWVEKTEELWAEQGTLCRSEKEARKAADRRMAEINKLNQNHARHAHVSTTGDIYVHTDRVVPAESRELMVRAILPDYCGLTVVESSRKPSQVVC